jgi:transcriptional regulator with XRE-family HTH domain
MARARNYSPTTTEAACLLGARIREARIQRRFTQAELAERVGVTKLTIGKVERGDLGVALGTVFEAAAISGVDLFDADPARRQAEARRVRDVLALLPDQVQPRRGRARDDF